jgi:hypothetical protein
LFPPALAREYSYFFCSPFFEVPLGCMLHNRQKNVVGGGAQMMLPG